jgi:ASC-1-like (ASCH) protein
MLNQVNRVHEIQAGSRTEQIRRLEAVLEQVKSGERTVDMRLNPPINGTGHQGVPIVVSHKLHRIEPLIEEMRPSDWSLYQRLLRELSVDTVKQLARELEEIATWYRLDYHRKKRVLEPYEEQTRQKIEAKYGRKLLMAHAKSPVTCSLPGDEEWDFAINLGCLWGKIKLLKWLMGHSLRRFNTASLWVKP